MNSIEASKKLVLQYFHSWQKPDFEELRATLRDDVVFDMNGNKIIGAEPFVEMCKNGIKWRKVDLIDSIFTEDKASLIYDGVTINDEKVRVGELITINNGKISKAVAAIVGNG